MRCLLPYIVQVTRCVLCDIVQVTRCVMCGYRTGNEVCFSLETASDYVKDEKACFFGFRCTVVGYEWPSSAHLVSGRYQRTWSVTIHDITVSKI